jgi:hypothetical protein
MKTLVIHAPSSKAQGEGKRSFEETVKRQIGDGYVIARTELPLITPGCNVVVLDNETEKRAEGKLVKLEQEGFTNTGMLRYNVHMKDLRKVSYKPIGVRLNHRGIAII